MEYKDESAARFQEKLKSWTHDFMVSRLSASSLHICFVLFSPHNSAPITCQDKRKHGSSHFWGLSLIALTSGRLPCLSTKSKPWGRNSWAHLNQVSFSGPINCGQEVRPEEKAVVFRIDTLNLAEMDASVIVYQDCVGTEVASPGKARTGWIVQVCPYIPISKLPQDLTENNFKQVENFTKYCISLDWYYNGIWSFQNLLNF